MTGRLAQVHPMPTTNKSRSDEHNRLTTCSACRLGIFRGQPSVWSQDPLGLIHTYCQETT